MAPHQRGHSRHCNECASSVRGCGQQHARPACAHARYRPAVPVAPRVAAVAVNDSCDPNGGRDSAARVRPARRRPVLDHDLRHREALRQTRSPLQRGQSQVFSSASSLALTGSQRALSAMVAETCQRTERNLFSVPPFCWPKMCSVGGEMGKGLLLWLIGIPLPIILVIWLFGGLN